MNCATKSAIHKTITAIRAAREYQKMLQELQLKSEDPSGITIVFTGHVMKVGGSGKVLDDFIKTGRIEWPKIFDIVCFDETFTYGKRLPQDGIYSNNLFKIFLILCRIVFHYLYQ